MKRLGMNRCGVNRLRLLWMLPVAAGALAALGAAPARAGDFAGFAEAQFYDTNGDPREVALGDLDGDGDLDAAVTNQQDTVAIMLNDGSGAFFTPYPDVKVGFFVRGLDIADLDGDGDMDIAVANQGSHTVSLMFNVGNNTFNVQTLPAGHGPLKVLAADLDGDSDQDLVVTHQEGGSVGVYLNKGGGDFADPDFYFVGGGSPQETAAGDLDGDGDVDLAVGKGFSDTLTVLLNDGAGVFEMQEPINVWASFRVAVADMEGDGDLDVMTTGAAVLGVLLNNGDGNFEVQNPLITGDYTIPGGPGTSGVQAGDLDLDGWMDLAVSNSFFDEVAALTYMQGGPFGFFIDPTGFGGLPDWVVDGNDITSLLGDWGPFPVNARPDYNLDGVVDGADLGILLGHWGKLPEPVIPPSFPVGPPGGTVPPNLELGDVDGDNDLDIVTASGDLAVLLNKTIEK